MAEVETVRQESEREFEENHKAKVLLDLESLSKEELVERCLNLEKERHVGNCTNELLEMATTLIFYSEGWNGVDDLEPGDKELILRYIQAWLQMDEETQLMEFLHKHRQPKKD